MPRSGAWLGSTPISPSVVRATSISASPDQIRSSTATTLTGSWLATLSPCSAGVTEGVKSQRRGARPKYGVARATLALRVPAEVFRVFEQEVRHAIPGHRGEE